ncbi:hypothetical protein [Thermoflexibacter ruber]|uniref:Uncharacterized protein n=1 Tax=Thermoflexibacter ruber TaxID=1003 RepID=A0A1I2JV77_9BACT|nr:hypothetical protein [Thermoflexibacter ruber]SFF57958.1 hypothetical protein SAMN04488541_10667 [Thermoflexibacter ruber]
MALISKKKVPYKISDKLRRFLHKYSKEIAIPLQYQDLCRYIGATILYDKYGEDTLWLSVYYSQSDQEHIFGSLKKIYALLKIDGNMSVIDHLMVDRIDVCTYGNTRPFRVRIVNKINDNFDYFYVKIADASRIYGLELEDIMSPNRVRYLVHKDTLIEEHIIGIPGDQFIKHHLREVNKIRLAKEFIKFNERCFVRLLGDMHSSNFVVDITPDFEEMHYRIRSIDFDQQSYEGRKNVYLPQYFKQNNPILNIGFEVLTYESVRQYQLEERSLIANRLRASRYLLRDIMGAMIPDKIAPEENVISLREELAQHYQNSKFLRASSMGDILKESLKQLFR